MGWIGIAGGNSVNVKRGKKKPFTPEQYNAVLAFFQENKGNFYTVIEVDEGAEIGSELKTKAIIDVQIQDPKTGVRKAFVKPPTYGIPKKKKK